MSVESFAAFLDSNPDIATTVASCETYDQVSEIAKAHGFDVSGAELTRYSANAVSELSDSDLEAVAGGSWTGKPSGDAVASTAAVASAAGAAKATIAAYTAVQAIIMIK